MKLHLPKKLLAAVLALFAIGSNTTIGSDTISINFGSGNYGVQSSATGELWGAGGDDWNNFTIATNSGVSLIGAGTGDDRKTYANAFSILNKGLGAWSPTQTDWAETGTVAAQMQGRYFDLNANNRNWQVEVDLDGTISVANAAHTRVDIKVYFSGDSDNVTSYSSVKVGDTSYIGGQDAVVTSPTRWGKRGNKPSGTLGDHNTVWVTNLTVEDLDKLVIQNEWIDQDTRGTASGIQIKLIDTYDASLESDVVDAETVAWSGVDGFRGTYTTIENVADRYLRADVSAGDAILVFDAGAEIATLHAKGGHRLSVQADGAIKVGEYYTEAGSTISIGENVLENNGTLAISGAGIVEFAGDYTLSQITGYGNLHVADGVTVNVSSFDLVGKYTGGMDSALNVNLAVGNSATVNGITVANNKGTVRINAVAEGVTDVTASDGSGIGISSAGGVLKLNAEPGAEVTLDSLAVTGGSETKLTVGEDVTLAGDNLGQLNLGNSQILTVTDGVALGFQQAEDSSGGRAIVMGSATLNVDGGSVVAESICMAEGNGSTSNLVITSGGYMEITGSDNDNGKYGSICFNHWQYSNVTVSVTDGEFRSLNAKVNVGESTTGTSTSVVIGEQGVMNVYGLRMISTGTVSVSGTLNLGAGSITNQYGVLTVDGGTLGALDENGWSTAQNIAFNGDSTIYLAKYDVNTGAYTGSVDITLTGSLTGTGTLTLAGGGKLTVSRALTADVVSDGGALVIDGVQGLEFLGVGGTVSGYGDSTTDGYTSAQYRIAGAGSTITEATLLSDTDNELTCSVVDGVMTVDNGTVFAVNTEVDRAKIDWKDGTSLVLGSGSVYHTSVVEDLGVVSTVADDTAAVYLQNTEGKDLLKITDVPLASNLNVTIGGEGNNEVICNDSTFTGDFTVLKGAILKQSDAEGSGGWDITGEGYDVAPDRTITVQDTAIFDINGKEAHYHVVLEKGATLANTGAGVDYFNHRNLALVELAGDATINAQSTLGIVGGGYKATELLLNGHTLTVEGGDTFLLNNCTVSAGTIHIKDGSVELLEYDGPRKTDLSAATVEVATTTITGEDNTETVVQGGLVYAREGNAAIQIGHLVASGGYVQTTSGRELVINEISGSSFTKYGTGVVSLKDGITITEDLLITADASAGSIGLSTVNVAAGKTLAITGTATADTLALTGDGNLTIAVLNAGTVQMSSGMTIATLTGGAQIAYTDVASIGSITALGGDTIIDLFGVADAVADGINLGIAYTEDNVSKLQLIALDDMVDSEGNATWELVDDNGYIKLQGKDGAKITLHTDWDINWGAAGLVGAPAAVTVLDNATGSMNLDLAPTEITGGGSNTTIIAGGHIYDPYTVATATTGDSWIKVSGGTFESIVGGNVCNNWGTGASGNADFVGNSHIMMTGGTTTYVVGGNDHDAQDPTFTGNSYITIAGDAKVLNSVVGAGLAVHGGGNDFMGDTNIFVYTVLDGDGYVMGGHYHTKNTSTTLTVGGSTNITIDVSEYTGDSSEFAKRIVGGSYANWYEGTESRISILGDTNVTITAKDGISFSEMIIGGSLLREANRSEIAGTTNININGGAYGVLDEETQTYSGGLIVGGSYMSMHNANAIVNGVNVGITNGTFNATVVGGNYYTSTTARAANGSIGSVSIDIENGTFNDMVVAGSYFLNAASGTAYPTSTIDSTSVTISGGTFNGKVVGGDALMPKWFFNSNVGAVSITIDNTYGEDGKTIASSPQFNDHIIGGTYKALDGAGGQKIIVGDVLMTLKGGTMTAGKMVVGGSWIGDTGVASIGTATVGDINLTIQGGTWQDVLGGSYVERKNTHYVAQGDIVVDLQGGTVSGNVYAGGQQVNDSYLTAESTTVKVGSAVSLTQGKVVSAGYLDTNTGDNHSTIAGDRTILFTGEESQDRTGILFSDFNKIGVETAGTTATIGGADITITDALAVIGEGTLKLAANTGLNATQGITIEAGATVALNGNAATGDVLVNGGVDVVGGGSLNGSLTLAAGSSLTLWDGTEAGANGLLDMSVPTVEGTALLSEGNALTIGGLFGLNVKVNPDGEVELVTGIGSLTGIEFDDENKVLANTVLSDINGEDVDGKLYLVYEDGTLKLSAIAGMTDFYWEDTDTTTEKWTEKLWSVKDNNGDNLVNIKDAATRAEEVNAIFNNGKAETVLVDTAATVDDLTVSGAGSDYTFAADATTPGTLTIEGKLTVTDSATATFDGALANVGAAELEVSAGGTLNAGAVTITGAATVNGGTLGVTSLGSDSLSASNGAAVNATNIVIAGTAEIAGSTVDAAGLLSAAGVVISGEAAKVEAAQLKVGEGGLSMSAGTLNAGSLFSNDGVTAKAEITGGTVTIGGSTLSSTTVTGAEFVGESTLAGAADKAVTVGNITVDSAGELTLSDATLNGKITVEDGGTLEFGGAMHLDTTANDFGLVNKSTYASTAADSDLGKEIADGGNGFVSRNEVYTAIDGSLTNVDPQDSSWTVGEDKRVGSYADGKVTVSESKDTTAYWVNTNVTLSNVSGNFVEDTATIKLNGGMLQMNESTDLAIATNNENPNGTESTIALQNGATLESAQLTIADGTTVVLRGQAGTTLDLGTEAGVDSALKGLGDDTWMGKVTTAATDITDVASLGNADSAVELTGAVDSGVIALGNVGTVHATDSLTAESISGTGALEVDGLATLKKGTSSLGNAAFDGGLVLGGDEAAALTGSDLTAASVELTKGSIEADTLTVGGALTINDGSLNVDGLEVEGATTVGGAAKSSIIVNGDAYMTGGVELGKGSSLDVEGALVLDGSAIKYNDLDSKVTAGTYDDEKLALVVDTEQLKDAVDAGKDVTLFTLTEGTSEAAISLNGGSNVLSAFGEKYSYSLDWDDAGQNVTLDSVANKNYMKEKFNGASANAKAGATIMDEAFASGATNADGDLKKILAAVDNGAMTEEGLASVAGSSTAALGMAFAGDVDRQLRAIRNRTTTMGVNQCVVNEGMPYFNAWVNAEGNLGELDKDGTFAGYQLDSWGGTIGFDVDVNPNLTLGLAVTAMYGDLTVDGPDKLDGDLDTMYVSAFARYSARAWTHTFVGTVGMMDSSYKRTVSYGQGESYKTEGDTDGMAFGLMYEVGRVIALTESGSACLQPVFNVAYRHTTAGGYTEKGGDAALKVDDQTLDTVTLGAGARLQAVVGENLYNRTSLLELRALAKVDLGDRASEADVAFIGGAGKATVESAELGAFGVELGAGLSVPMGDEDSGTLFFDVSAELRSGYTNLNGTVGYRINF